MKNIDTEKFSSHLREKAIDLTDRRILITNFSGSEQEKDLSEPSNCNGFGRVRHFKFDAGVNWPSNPLPILPAAKALKISHSAEIRAQVFQNSACNWRCWYCFVDFSLLAANPKYASFLSCSEMVDLYLASNSPASMIDLTGGQPDLTPEWIPWMMQELIDRNLDQRIYLWSDDNLSNDYFWKYLSPHQIDLISNYKMYSRVCCFKGIDEESFSKNTNADPSLFKNQFELFKRLLDIKLDLYGYITLTATTNTNFELVIPRLFDSLQNIHQNLPLRIVPLKIFPFTPVKSRLNDEFENMMIGQHQALKFWNQELNNRFSQEEKETVITEIKLK
jgi:uncharacterized Fe-S cluster-containing radical SAM superfamily protein